MGVAGREARRGGQQRGTPILQTPQRRWRPMIQGSRRRAVLFDVDPVHGRDWSASIL